MGLTGTLEVSRDALGEGSGDANTSQEILDVLKDIRNEMAKNTKLQQTGFINGLGGLGSGGISRLLGGLGSTAALAIGGSLALSGDQRSGQTQLGYDKGINSKNENIYFEIDNKTGELLDVLTEQEAIDKGILDEKGKIRELLKTQHPIWKKTTEQMGRYKDSIVFTTENVDKITALTSEEVAVRKSIINALSEQYKKISGKTFKQRYDDARQRETGRIQNEEQGDAAFQSFINQQLYPGAVPPSQALIGNYFSQRASESSQQQEAMRLIRSQLPLVDSTAYIPVGK